MRSPASEKPDDAAQDPEPALQDAFLTAQERNLVDRVNSAPVFSNRKHIPEPIRAADDSEQARARINAIPK